MGQEHHFLGQHIEYDSYENKHTLHPFKFITDTLTSDSNESELSSSHYGNGGSSLQMLLQIWLKVIKASSKSTLISLKCNLLLQSSDLMSRTVETPQRGKKHITNNKDRVQWKISIAYFHLTGIPDRKNADSFCFLKKYQLPPQEEAAEFPQMLAVRAHHSSHFPPVH